MHPAEHFQKVTNANRHIKNFYFLNLWLWIFFIGRQEKKFCWLCTFLCVRTLYNPALVLVWTVISSYHVLSSFSLSCCTLKRNVWGKQVSTLWTCAVSDDYEMQAVWLCCVHMHFCVGVLVYVMPGQMLAFIWEKKQNYKTSCLVISAILLLFICTNVRYKIICLFNISYVACILENMSTVDLVQAVYLVIIVSVNI